MLYKIIDNRLEAFKGRYIRHGGKVYANPTEEQLRAAGWKPLITEDRPEDTEDYYYTAQYTESETAIKETWLKHEYESEVE